MDEPVLSIDSGQRFLIPAPDRPYGARTQIGAASVAATKFAFTAARGLGPLPGRRGLSGFGAVELPAVARAGPCPALPEVGRRPADLAEVDTGSAAKISDKTRTRASVRDHVDSWQSFPSMMRTEAGRRKASALRVRHAQSSASRRHRSSRPIGRSTIRRPGRTSNPTARSERLTISTVTDRHTRSKASRNAGPRQPPSAYGVGRNGQRLARLGPTALTSLQHPVL